MKISRLSDSPFQLPPLKGRTTTDHKPQEPNPRNKVYRSVLAAVRVDGAFICSCSLATEFGGCGFDSPPAAYPAQKGRPLLLFFTQQAGGKEGSKADSKQAGAHPPLSSCSGS
jgi:hypothetical protein